MSRSTPPAVVILIDAFRSDFLTDELTPNLAKIANNSFLAPLRPILGYSDSIRAVAFTGRYPDETGYWMEYCYRPSQSPWRGFHRLAALDRLPAGTLTRATRLASSMTALKAAARLKGLPSLEMRNMPFRAADRFDFTLAVPMTAPNAMGCPSFFDSCVASGSSWVYLDASKHRRSANLLREVREVPEDTGLIFVYLHQIDMAAHLFGIEAPVFWRRVQATDRLLGSVMTELSKRFGDFSPLIFSDHGMSQLRNQYSLQDLVLHPAFPERFFMALDATMVRLWFFDDDEALRQEIRDRVASRYPGRFLTSSDLDKFHLRFEDRLYGDEIYLLEPGIGIFPNYHSYIKPKAMHAYDPGDPDQLGICVAPYSVAPAGPGPVEMPAVHSVVMAMLAERGLSS